MSVLSRADLEEAQTHLSVKLKEDLPRTLLSVECTDCEQLDREGLTLLNRDGKFLADLGLAEEVSGRDDPEGEVSMPAFTFEVLKLCLMISSVVPGG